MRVTDSSSPGVYSGERNLSQRAADVQTSIAACPGAAHRGPVMVPTLCVDDEDLRSKFGIKDVTQTGYGLYCAEGFLTQGRRLLYIRLAENALYGSAKIATQGNFAVGVEQTDGMSDPEAITFAANDILHIAAENPGEWNNDLTVVFYPNVDDPDNESFIIQVFEGANKLPVEEHECTLWTKVDGHGIQRFVEDRISTDSTRIRVTLNRNHPAFATNPKPDLINAIGEVDLKGGDNGDPMHVLNDQVRAKLLEAWGLLDDWEEYDVNLLINAGYADPVIQLEMDRIAKLRKDCLPIFDTPLDYQEEAKFVQYRRDVLNLNSSEAALYGPDILVHDADNGVDLFVPPSGHIAARYAYTDRNFYPWYAVAGVNRGTIPEALDVRFHYKKGHLNAAAENQYNPLVVQDGYGVCIWGADTLEAQKSALNDIGIRRLLNYIHASVRISQLWAVFVPNDTQLQDRLRRNIEGLLEPIRRNRGLYWFEVVCSFKNNPNDSVARGDLICDIYMDPTRYTKRIHVNTIIPPTGEVDFAVSLIDR